MKRASHRDSHRNTFFRILPHSAGRARCDELRRRAAKKTRNKILRVVQYEGRRCVAKEATNTPRITHSRDESFIKEDVLEILPYPL